LIYLRPERAIVKIATSFTAGDIEASVDNPLAQTSRNLPAAAWQVIYCGIERFGHSDSGFSPVPN
jgi:hypothetical protein